MAIKPDEMVVFDASCFAGSTLRTTLPDYNCCKSCGQRVGDQRQKVDPAVEAQKIVRFLHSRIQSNTFREVKRLLASEPDL